MLNINKWFTRRWAKINESIWTRLFILTSIIQTILVIVLESRVFERNNSIRLFVKGFKDTEEFTTCKIDSAEQRMIQSSSRYTPKVATNSTSRITPRMNTTRNASKNGSEEREFFNEGLRR
ncbi:19052_t:CDS:2 [Funneliformis geosporum]|uniref:19052_t:CDS:1 n=1 Tax=Funneliformis geosporum TaxID=1117311 RepID=A0A9W4WNI3_9GLOM|nr:19052_t:CDS:2 [Funneliformis geosporum]